MTGDVKTSYSEFGGPFFGSASVPSQDVLSSKIFGFIFVSGVTNKEKVLRTTTSQKIWQKIFTKWMGRL